MRKVERFGGKTYLVDQNTQHVYVSVHLIEPKFTMRDKQVFFAQGEDTQELIDCGTQELLQRLDEWGVLNDAAHEA